MFQFSADGVDVSGNLAIDNNIIVSKYIIYDSTKLMAGVYRCKIGVYPILIAS